VDPIRLHSTVCFSSLVLALFLFAPCSTLWRYDYSALPLSAFIIFFRQRARQHSRENSKTRYGGTVRGMSDSESPPQDAADEHRQALLAELEDDAAYSDDRDVDLFSAEGSGHNYRKIPAGRESICSADSSRSYETTSSSHTVFRTNATTSEFSASYHSYSLRGDPRFGGGNHSARPSESLGGYLGGSVIVNALMTPIGSSNNPYRNGAVNSAVQSGGALAGSTDNALSGGAPTSGPAGGSVPSFTVVRSTESSVTRS
jgi:hypothetical protein